MAAKEEQREFQKFLLISAGASHSVALILSDVVCSWGEGEEGKLGTGNAEDCLVPVHVSALAGHQVVSLICGADHTIAYSHARKQVYSWGCGDFGRLGHGDSSDMFIPHPIKYFDGLKIKQIACGDSHCLAITVEGEVASWGRNQNGQLGIGNHKECSIPHKIDAFEGIFVKMVAAGAEHSAAVTEAGDLYGWGWGKYGSLGLGDRYDRLLPEKVFSIHGEKRSLVACGWRHTVSATRGGYVYTYGWNKYGQLGHGDYEDHLVPRRVEELRNQFVSQISGGWRHTMALTYDGSLYGWGWNKFGQVGVRGSVDHCYPVGVAFPDDEEVVEVCCGWRHTVAVTEKKNVYSWGRGIDGQLGHGDYMDRHEPTIIEALSRDRRRYSSSSDESVTGQGTVQVKIEVDDRRVCVRFIC